MSDQEDFYGENSPISLKLSTAEVSDQEVEEQDTNSNTADHDNDRSISKESVNLEALAESPTQADTSVPQNPLSTFQLGFQENQGDVFEADSDSDVGISAAIEAVTRDEEDSPPVKQKRRFILDSDEDVQENEGSPPPAKKNKVEGKEGDFL